MRRNKNIQTPRVRGTQGVPSTLGRWGLVCLALSLAAFSGCASGYAGRTADFRQALDAADPERALAEVDRLVLEAEGSSNLQTHTVDSDYPLLLLERAAMHQAVGNHQAAVADFGGADQMLEVLDLTPSGAEAVGEYLWSDDSGVYRMPIYEKLMINIAALSSYLAMGDLAGARVEARRMNVLNAYFANTDLADHPVIGTANYMAGLTMELSGEPMAALRYYIDARRTTNVPGLDALIARLSQGTVLADHEQVVAAREELGLAAGDATADQPAQEVVAIVFSGVAPQREAEHYPIGVVLGWVSNRYTWRGDQRTYIDRIDAEDLVTWLNFPVLVARHRTWRGFDVHTSSGSGSADRVADTQDFALAQWLQDRPGIAFAAITRAIVRVLAREAIQAVGDDSTESQILSLLVQGGMQAMDTPDTRTWSAMPAEVWVARIPTNSGPQTVTISSNGGAGAQSREVDVDVPAGGAAVVTVRFFD